MKLIAIREKRYGNIQWKIGDICNYFTLTNDAQDEKLYGYNNSDAWSLDGYEDYFVPLAEYRDKRIDEIFD